MYSSVSPLYAGTKLSFFNTFTCFQATEICPRASLEVVEVYYKSHILGSDSWRVRVLKQWAQMIFNCIKQHKYKYEAQEIITYWQHNIRKCKYIILVTNSTAVPGNIDTKPFSTRTTNLKKKSQYHDSETNIIMIHDSRNTNNYRRYLVILF